MKELTEKQKESRNNFENNKEKLCNKYDYILKTVYHLGGGVMSLHQLKKYIAHFIKRSESTAYKQILELKKGGILKIAENLGYSYMVIRSYGIQYLLQKQGRYTVKDTDQLLLKSLYINQYIINYLLKDYPNISSLINALQQETTLLDSKYTDAHILYRYAERGDKEKVLAEIKRLREVKFDREVNNYLNHIKAIEKKKLDREFREKAEEEIKDKVEISETDREYWLRDRIEELKVEYLKKNPVKNTYEVKDEIEKEINLNNLNARNTYITKATYAPKNLNNRNYYIEVSMLDIRKRCYAVQIRREIYETYRYLKTVIGNTMTVNLKVIIHTSSKARVDILQKQLPLIKQGLVNNKMAEIEIEINNLDIEKDIMKGALGFRI